ncbi:hypothetical protein [Roseovarius sp. M141]|nr:hypothetical protein [Roseovarius sp. M141]
MSTQSELPTGESIFETAPVYVTQEAPQLKPSGHGDAQNREPQE